MAAPARVAGAAALSEGTKGLYLTAPLAGSASGLALADSELHITAHSDRKDDYGVHIDVFSDMEIEGKKIEDILNGK